MGCCVHKPALSFINTHPEGFMVTTRLPKPVTAGRKGRKDFAEKIQKNEFIHIFCVLRETFASSAFNVLAPE